MSRFHSQRWDAVVETAGFGGTYGAEFGVVVPGEGVKCPHLHPAPAQLLRRVLKEPTDVSADLKQGAKHEIK